MCFLSILKQMGFGAASFLTLFVSMVVIGYTNADQQKPSSFLSSYDSYRNICRKIGWEPKCREQPITTCQGKIIAFHAVLSKALTNVPSNAIIKFEKLLINEGNGYAPNTGKFTAPVDGIYSFSWNYETNKGTTAYLGGYVDGTLTAKVALERQTSTWMNTSGYLVTKMKKGSQFWIQNFSSTIQLVQSDYTSLSGFKISGC